MDEKQFGDLMAAIDRNTSATRSIAIFMLGWIVWFLIGISVILLSGLFLSIVGLEAAIASALMAIGGALIILIGAIRAIGTSLRELSKSSK